MEKKMISSSMAPISPLPNDVIAQILSWVSVSSLMQFRWTCKYWFNLITKDEAFSNLHFLHHNSTSLLIFTNQSVYNLKNYIFSNSTTIANMDSYNLFPSTCNPRDKGKFLGSCNGLIYVYRDRSFYYLNENDYSLWNPSTREIKELPQLPKISINNIAHSNLIFDFDPNLKFIHGFCYDNIMQDYKVIRISYSSAINEEEDVINVVDNVYSLRTNSWHTKLDTIPLFKDAWIMKRTGLFVNGALHWIFFPRRDMARIITFDITKEEHGEIECPEDFDSCCSELVELHGCLCVFGSNLLAVNAWMMKDYGVKESWNKSFTINLAVLSEFSYQCFPVKYDKDSGILMLYEKRYLAAYDTKNNEVIYLQNIVDARLDTFTYDVVTYVESLVSLNSGRFLRPTGSRETTVIQMQRELTR